MKLIDDGILNNVKSSIYHIAEIKKDNKELCETLINNWNNIAKLFLGYDLHYDWPMSKNKFLTEFDLNKSSLGNQLRRWTRRGILKKGDDYVIEGTTGPHAGTYINEKGAIKILERSPSIKGAKFLSKLGRNIELKQCVLYTKIIEYATRGVDNPKREFTTNNPRYRIDLYLEKSKLPIECDELGHEHESPSIRNQREEAIKKKLGCDEFLRFNPHEPNFDIGEIISKTFYHILGIPSKLTRELTEEELADFK